MSCFISCLFYFLLKSHKSSQPNHELSLTFHSECLPISSYSELSAQILHYDTPHTNLQSSGSSARSTAWTSSQDSYPFNLGTMPSAGKGPTSPKSFSFEARIPRQVIDKVERSPPPNSLSRRRKQRALPSSSSSVPSSSTEPSRSCTYPHSESQGTSKVVGMNNELRKPRNLACLMCRERKIKCQRPPEDSNDPSCK